MHSPQNAAAHRGVSALEFALIAPLVLVICLALAQAARVALVDAALSLALQRAVAADTALPELPDVVCAGLPLVSGCAAGLSVREAAAGGVRLVRADLAIALDDPLSVAVLGRENRLVRTVYAHGGA